MGQCPSPLRHINTVWFCFLLQLTRAWGLWGPSWTNTIPFLWILNSERLRGVVSYLSWFLRCREHAEANEGGWKVEEGRGVADGAKGNHNRERNRRTEGNRDEDPERVKVTGFPPPWWTRAMNGNKPSPKHIFQVSCPSEEKGNWANGAESCCQMGFGRWIGRGEMSGTQSAGIRWYHQTCHLFKQCTLAPLLHHAWGHLVPFCILLPTFSSLCCAHILLLQHIVYLTSY